jgi:hypothetical protein
MKDIKCEMKETRNKNVFFLLVHNPCLKFRHACVLKTVNCENVITIIDVIFQRICDIILCKPLRFVCFKEGTET